MLRRTFLSGTTALLPLAVLLSCTGTTSATQFAMAKSYLDAGVGAVLAGSQTFLAGPPLPTPQTAATVTAIMEKLSAAKSAIDGTVAVTDWQAGANEVLSTMQLLSPLVAGSLGAAAPYIPLAIAVVTAFIQSLPPPVTAPPVPPAALTHKAAEYRRLGT